MVGLFTLGLEEKFGHHIHIYHESVAF